MKLFLLFLFSACFFSHNIWAQATAGSRQVPFRYLNQYFQYQIKNQDQISIAGKIFDFKNFEIVINSDSAEIDIQNLQPWILQTTTFYFKDENFVILKKVAVGKDRTTFSFKVPATAKHICLTSISRFTEIEFCKGLIATEANPAVPPKVVANGETLENMGLVVLKEKDVVLDFSAILSTDHRVNLKTKKRNVLPVSLRKSSDSDIMTVIFQDQSVTEKNAWEEKVSIEQSFIYVRLDPLLNIRQDLFYNDVNLKMSPLNYTSTSLRSEPVGRLEENGLTTEVFGKFSGLKGTSPNLNVALNSDLGKGIRTTYRWSLSPKFRGFAQAHIYQTIIATDSTNSIKNGNQMPYAAAGGAEYQLTNQLSVLTQARLQKDLFFKATAANNIEVTTGQNTEISVAPTWQIFRTFSSKLSSDVTLSYLSTSDAGGFSATGMKTQLGLSYLQRFSVGQFAFNASYGQRIQNFENFKFSEQIAFYGLGYHYQF